jgi:hypothetical protein
MSLFEASEDLWKAAAGRPGESYEQDAGSRMDQNAGTVALDHQLYSGIGSTESEFTSGHARYLIISRTSGSVWDCQVHPVSGGCGPAVAPLWPHPIDANCRALGKPDSEVAKRTNSCH